MKILLYCPFKFDLKYKFIDQLGGIETLNLELAKKLSSQNHNVYIATYCNKILKKNKITNIPINKLNSLFF